MNSVHFLSISQTAFKQKMTKLYNHKMTATAGTWNWVAVDGESCDNIARQIFQSLWELKVWRNFRWWLFAVGLHYLENIWNYFILFYLKP